MITFNNKGFTVVEVMIGIGLAAMLTVAVISTQLMVTKDQMDLRDQLDQSIDQSLAERILFVDFNAIDPSYNNISITDDNGLNFFDYYPDVPANMVDGSLERTITLRGDSTSLSMSVVSQDIAAGATMVYDPTAAYDIGAPPADFNKAASLDFNSLNKNNWITSTSLGNRPGFWVDGTPLMLDTPARLRPIVNGAVNMKVAPRSPIFVGYVNGKALSSVGPTEVGSMFKLTQPDTGAPIDTADTFLRNAPSIGGGQALVRLRALKILKYYLEPQKGVTADCKIAGSAKTYYHSNFYKLIYKNGKFANSVLLADKVCAFTVHRDSVLKRMVYFKITKVKDSQKEASASTAGL